MSASSAPAIRELLDSASRSCSMSHNTERLNDPEYLGWHPERIIGQDYFDFEQIHPARETCEG